MAHPVEDRNAWSGPTAEDPHGWGGPTVEIDEGGLDTPDAMTDAYKRSVEVGFDQQVGFLLQHVGPRVTSAALGLRDARQLTKWWRGQHPKSEAMVARVHLLFRIAYAVTAVYSGGTAARFLRSSNPSLGDMAPGTVLRGEPEEEASRLLAATRAFLEG